jgi:DNA (cytosine-5)-methyltransferase 1
MENVSNIINEKFMPQFNNWILELKNIGYNSSWNKIKACDYGGGTVRERVFMISTLDTFPIFIFPEKTGTTKTILDYLEEPNPKYFIDNYTGIDVSNKNYTKSIKLADYNNGGQGNRIYSSLGQGVTLTASGGGKAGSSGGLYLRGNKIYKLSPIEMCKVMGWNKKEAQIICSAASDREVGFCLGNAIDLNVMKAIMKEIITQYKNQFEN